MAELSNISNPPEEFASLTLTQQKLLALRSALRGFIPSNVGSMLDISREFLLPSCRLLLQSLIHERFQNTLTHPALKRSVLEISNAENFATKNLLRDSVPLNLANSLLEQSTALLWKTIDDVGVAYGTTTTDLEFASGWLSNKDGPAVFHEGYDYITRASARDSDHSAERVFMEPLFGPGNPLKALPKNDTAFGRYFNESCFSFWRRWYQGFLDGKPLNWELQSRVALIENNTWQAGPEAVAKEIERIQAEMLSEKLPVAETIEANPETGQFRVVPIPAENPATVSALLLQIEDSLEDCLGGHNGLAQQSGTMKKLNRVLTKYREDPQNAELTLTRVAGSLRSQLYDTRELPDNEDNLALLNAVEEGVRGIRANHQEVAKNREHLAQQAMRTLAPEDKELLMQALPVLCQISEPEMAEDFESDIPELINDALLPLSDGAPLLPGADVTTRVFSRVSKMALLTQSAKELTNKGAQVFDSDLSKSIRLAGTTISVAGGVGGLLYAIVQIGLRILGVL